MNFLIQGELSMYSKKFDHELSVAKRIALQTWDKIAHYYDTIITPKIKLDGTHVTEADTFANRFIVENLQESFPNDSIVSEEEKSVLKGKRTWYVDPIDGTNGFYRRNGQFAIHMGLCEGEHPVMGVVYWPVTGDLYWGIVGQEAYRENSRGSIELRVRRNGQKELTASVSDREIPSDVNNLLIRLGVTAKNNSGSEGLRLMKIAENLADLRITEKEGIISTWDVCAPHAILKAAGGDIRYLDGSPLKYHGQRALGRRYAAVNNVRLLNKIISFYKSEAD